MCLRLVLALSLMMAFAAPAPAQQPSPQPSVQFDVAQSSPALSAGLAADEPLYIRLTYQSTRPVRFRADGYVSGQKTTAGATFNIAPPYPAGKGEALVWIGYRFPITITEIRIEALDEKWKPLASKSLTAHLSWGEATRRQLMPAWAERLNREQQAMGREISQRESEKYARQGAIIMGVAMVSIFGYPLLQVFLPIFFAGVWRWAALLPLAIMGPLVIHAILALNAGSNLWPIWLIFAAPIVFGYLLIIMIARWIAARTART